MWEGRFLMARDEQADKPNSVSLHGLAKPVQRQ